MGMYMEDEEAALDGTAAGDVDADTDDAGDEGTISGRVPVVTLVAALVVLVVFGAVMTALYVRQSGARADRERDVATRTSELASVRASLAAAQNQRTLDPKGYDAIKKCIEQAVDEEKLSEEVRKSFEGAGLPTPLPTAPPTITTTTLPGGAVLLPGSMFTFADPQVCEDAAAYLK
jgi:type II secretory pathway pseudopilin PulG